MVEKGKMERIIKRFGEDKILLALYRYYISDITFEKAAEEANVPVYFLVQYVNDNNLPIVLTEKDVTDGIRKVMILMRKEGMDICKLHIPISA